MQAVDQDSAGNSALGLPVYWHFRALPHDVQRVTIRRLALSGLRDREIAARTGLPEETVRRVVAEDECLRTLLRTDLRPRASGTRNPIGDHMDSVRLLEQGTRNSVHGPACG